MIDTSGRAAPDQEASYPDLATLDRSRSDKQVRRGSRLRLVGTAVLALVVLAGAIGLLGVRSGTVRAESNGVALEVEYGAITRAGLSSPFRITVQQAEPFDGPISISVSRQLFDRFDFQNFYPNPSKETSDADWVSYEFDEPEGSTFVWNFDVRTGPNQVMSWSSYKIQVRDSLGSTLVQTEARIVVMP